MIDVDVYVDITADVTAHIDCDVLIAMVMAKMAMMMMDIHECYK